MKIHYRYEMADGTTNAVVANMAVAVEVERKNPGKAFWQLVTGTLTEQLAIVHEAYIQQAAEGETTLMFEDWRRKLADFTIDGYEETSLPPLPEAEMRARGIKRMFDTDGRS